MDTVPIQSGLTTTDVLAIIGAVTGIVGTIAGVSALVWDYYKWRHSERVRLTVLATPGFVSTSDPYTKYIHISVTNVGKIPTTIKLLSFHGFDSKKHLKSRRGHHVSLVMTLGYGTLPVRLNPGDDWIGGIRQDQFVEYQAYKYFYVQIEDTMSEFPFRAEIEKTLIWPDA
ncbi:MAG: hypothetical protein JSS77_10250 [Acidobacteria bacterium]|nr:hypothetical protein [Acidobacteriota bacterium]